MLKEEKAKRLIEELIKDASSHEELVEDIYDTLVSAFFDGVDRGLKLKRMNLVRLKPH